jgi:hypothetical protein
MIERMQERHGGEDRFSYRLRLVRFVPYGVAEWAGPRRLEFWQRSGPDADRADQVWLAHDDQDAGTSLVVGTFDPHDRAADSYDLAEDVAIKLVNISLPAPDLPRPEGFNKRLLRYAKELAARRDRWPSMPATVDGDTAPLRYTQFAGSWAGAVDGYSIGLYSTGQRPSALTLTSCYDTSPYGFDRHAGVRFVDMQSPESWLRRDNWHPDHYLLR